MKFPRCNFEDPTSNILDSIVNLCKENMLFVKIFHTHTYRINYFLLIWRKIFFHFQCNKGTFILFDTMSNAKC